MKLTKRNLKREYLKNKKTTYQIANMVGCSRMTVSRYLKIYKIPKRINSLKYPKLTKEYLLKEYIINKKTAPTIAEELNCNPSTVYFNLKKYKIKIRSNKEYINRHHTEKTKKILRTYRGEKHSQWKGGKSLNKKKYAFEYYRKNTIKIKERALNWYLKNKTRALETAKKYNTQRRKRDFGFRMEHILRSRLCSALKGKTKSKSTLKLLGCTILKLKQHLENQFKKGMNWSNYGNGWYGMGMEEWHIDHIRPCASFDLSKPEEQHKCFNYTNLQPLWAKENLEKHIKWD